MSKVILGRGRIQGKVLVDTHSDLHQGQFVFIFGELSGSYIVKTSEHGITHIIEKKDLEVH